MPYFPLLLLHVQEIFGRDFNNIFSNNFCCSRSFDVPSRLAARENGSNEWWYEDDEDEDFDFSDDSDGSDEEDILCNTMLLTGPTGCGKTSAVYACAEELGFKVQLIVVADRTRYWWLLVTN